MDDQAPRELLPVGRFDWERIVLRAELSAGTKAVALALATFGDAAGVDIRPGHRRISDALNVNDRSTRGHIDALLDAGLLELVSGGAPGRAAVYRLTMPADGTLAMRLDPDWRRLIARPSHGRRGGRREPNATQHRQTVACEQPPHRQTVAGDQRQPVAAVEPDTGKPLHEHRQTAATTPATSCLPPDQDQTRDQERGDTTSIGTSVDAHARDERPESHGVESTTPRARRPPLRRRPPVVLPPADTVDGEDLADTAEYRAARDVLATLPDFGVALIDRARAEHPDADMPALVIAAATLAEPLPRSA
jgi:hypothetical protein